VHAPLPYRAENGKVVRKKKSQPEGWRGEFNAIGALSLWGVPLPRTHLNHLPIKGTHCSTYSAENGNVVALRSGISDVGAIGSEVAALVANDPSHLSLASVP